MPMIPMYLAILCNEKTFYLYDKVVNELHRQMSCFHTCIFNIKVEYLLELCNTFWFVDQRFSVNKLLLKHEQGFAIHEDVN